MLRRTRIIALVAGLLLYAGQLEALVHAADHPFHIEDEVCAAFASFEQNDHAIAIPPSCNFHPQVDDEINTGTKLVISSNYSLSNRPRAPPSHT